MTDYISLYPTVQKAYEDDPRTALAQALLKQGLAQQDSIRSPWQGWSQVLASVLGKYKGDTVREEYQQRGQEMHDKLKSLMADMLSGKTDAKGLYGGVADIPGMEMQGITGYAGQLAADAAEARKEKQPIPVPAGGLAERGPDGQLHVTVAPPEKAPAPLLNLSQGGTVFDTKTGQPIYTAPKVPAADTTPSDVRTAQFMFPGDVAKQRAWLAQKTEGPIDARNQQRLDMNTMKFAAQLQSGHIPQVHASMNSLNTILKDYEVKGQGVPGVGRLKNIGIGDYFLSDEGKNVKSAAAAVMNDLLQMYSGLAVTPPEEVRRLREQMATPAFTAEDFARAWPRVVNRYNETLGNLKAGAPQGVIEQYEQSPGGVPLVPLEPAFSKKAVPQPAQPQQNGGWSIQPVAP